MKFRLIYTFFLLAFVAMISLGNKTGRASNGGKGSTGAPGDNDVVSGQLRTCQGCHAGSATIQVTLTIELLDTMTLLPVTQFTGGKTYKSRVTVNKIAGNPAGYGAQMVALLDAGNVEHKGFSSPSANAKLTKLSGAAGRTYLEHKTTSTTNIFEALWTAPAAGSGSVTFYSAGNGVNGNNASGGDAAAKTSFTVQDETVSAVDFQVEKSAAIVVSPNPVRDVMSLEINGLSPENDDLLEVFDSTGRLVFSQKMSGETALEIQTDGWPTGLLVVKISRAGRPLAVAKLVKVGH